MTSQFGAFVFILCEIHCAGTTSCTMNVDLGESLGFKCNLRQQFPHGQSERVLVLVRVHFLLVYLHVLACFLFKTQLFCDSVIFDAMVYRFCVFVWTEIFFSKMLFVFGRDYFPIEYICIHVGGA